MDRQYGVVLMGATGFTGRLVAEELARKLGPEDTPWALAGRSREKLEATRAGLFPIRPSAVDLPLIEVELSDLDGLRELAASTHVVISTAGPFDRLGHRLVEACVAEGTHYLDITGEPSFVDAIRKRHHEEAQRQHLKIVPCCGFDSVPADLGALFTVLQLPGEDPKDLRAYLRAKGRASGGTWASLLEAMAGGPPKASGGSTTNAAPKTLHPIPEGDGWGLPLPIIDPVLVKRSARAMPHIYSPFFSYGHYLRLPSRWAAVRLMAAVGVLAMLARIGPIRAWLAGRKPSGSGPDAEQRKEHFFHLDFYGVSAGSRVHTRVSGGDPGYTETSRMVAALALLMLDDRVALPRAGGVITPAEAFGQAGIDAVRGAGIHFQVIDEDTA